MTQCIQGSLRLCLCLCLCFVSVSVFVSVFRVSCLCLCLCLRLCFVSVSVFVSVCDVLCLCLCLCLCLVFRVRVCVCVCVWCFVSVSVSVSVSVFGVSCPRHTQCIQGSFHGIQGSFHTIRNVRLYIPYSVKRALDYVKRALDSVKRGLSYLVHVRDARNSKSSLMRCACKSCAQVKELLHAKTHRMPYLYRSELFELRPSLARTQHDRFHWKDLYIPYCVKRALDSVQRALSCTCAGSAHLKSVTICIRGCRILAQEPCILPKEPYIPYSVKRALNSVKRALSCTCAWCAQSKGILSQEPWILPKEPYIPWKEPYLVRAKRALHCVKGLYALHSTARALFIIKHRALSIVGLFLQNTELFRLFYELSFIQHIALSNKKRV